MLWTKSWVNVGLLSVTLAHIQHGAKRYNNCVILFMLLVLIYNILSLVPVPLHCLETIPRMSSEQICLCLVVHHHTVIEFQVEINESIIIFSIMHLSACLSHIFILTDVPLGFVGLLLKMFMALKAIIYGVKCILGLNMSYIPCDSIYYLTYYWSIGCLQM